MIISVVDIGSNTIKMKTFCYKNGILSEKHSLVKNAKLISYIDNGVLNENGISLLCDTVNQFKLEAESFGSEIFRCFATASLRRTSNSKQIIDRVLFECGEKIHLISGEDEAYYSFLGVKNTMQSFPEECIVIDMGGGSTEVIECESSCQKHSYSMGFGSLSLYIDFDKLGFDKMSQFAFNTVSKNKTANTDSAILVGGTAIAISKLYRYYNKAKDDQSMSVELLHKMYESIKSDEAKAKEIIQAIVPERATTVIPGLAAYLGIFEQYGTKNAYVSFCGIREGYVFGNILCENGSVK